MVTESLCVPAVRCSAWFGRSLARLQLPEPLDESGVKRRLISRVVRPPVAVRAQADHLGRMIRAIVCQPRGVVGLQVVRTITLAKRGRFPTPFTPPTCPA